MCSCHSRDYTNISVYLRIRVPTSCSYHSLDPLLQEEESRLAFVHIETSLLASYSFLQDTEAFPIESAIVVVAFADNIGILLAVTVDDVGT